MLLLTRKKNETIVIEGGITVTVVEIQDGRVRLGICAPKDIAIDRLEVYEAKLKDGSIKPGDVK